MVSWAVVISLYRGNKWFINRRPVAAESVATVATSTSGFDHVAPGREPGFGRLVAVVAPFCARPQIRVGVV